MRKKILVVDDDLSIIKFTRANLEAHGYETYGAADGTQAFQVIEEQLPDLIVLDIMMPDVDGYEIVRKLREWSQIPVIMLSALDDEKDKVLCLNLGADDYLCKPFGIDELLARIEAVFRRTKNTTISSNPAFTSGDFEVNFVARQVTINGREIKLTVKEYLVVSTLALASPKIVTFLSMLQDIWGPEYTDEKQYLHVFIMRLRKKIEEDPQKPQHIISERGVGYRLI